MSAKPDQPFGNRSKPRWTATPTVNPRANQRSGIVRGPDAKATAMKGTSGPWVTIDRCNRRPVFWSTSGNQLPTVSPTTRATKPNKYFTNMPLGQYIRRSIFGVVYPRGRRSTLPLSVRAAQIAVWRSSTQRCGCDDLSATHYKPHCQGGTDANIDSRHNSQDRRTPAS